MESSNLIVSSWYINRHRVVETLGLDFLGPRISSFLSSYSGQGNEPGILVSVLGSKLGAWLKHVGVKSFEELHIQGQLKERMIFCLESKMQSHGLSERHAYKGDKMVTLRRDLKEYGDNRQLVVKFHQDGLTTSSAWGCLMGQPRVFLVAYVQSIDDKQITCCPYVIGDLLIQQHSTSLPIHYTDSLEVRPSDFDAFKDVNFSERVSLAELSTLKHESEQKIKETFASMIGEMYIPKDWGGEYCDLYSSQVLMNGCPATCAFAFKGPSKFKPMDIADCGKNGDQIVRLYETSAEVLVLQHCHTVKPAVRKTMEAFARSFNHRERRYCIIDGYDTFKILRHLSRRVPNALT